MGHIIQQLDFSIKTSKEEIFAKCNEIAMDNSDCKGLPNNIDWRGDIIYETYEDAEKAIEKFDTNKFYYQVAVKYRDLRQEDIQKSLINLKEKKCIAYKEFNDLDKKVVVKSTTGRLKTCKHCESKIANKYICSNFCPVCKTDMRTETQLNKIKKAKEKCELLEKKELEERKRILKAKGEVRWLVKIEFHC